MTQANFFGKLKSSNKNLDSASGIWSLRDQYSAAKNGIWPSNQYFSDIYFNNVSLLLSGIGTNNANNNVFLDSSTNNYAVTRYGNVSQGAYSPYGTNWSSDFNGSTGFLSLAGNSAFSIATSTTPFTIECWVYPQGSGGCIFSEQYTTGGNSVSIAVMLSNGGGTGGDTSGLVVTFGYYTGSAWVNAAMANIALTSEFWSHVACVFTGSTTKIFINGIDVTKTSSPTPATTWGVTGVNGDAWYIGRRWDTAANPYFNGYINNFRFVNGTAVYTANFTPPTADLTAITNTSLLTCQNSYIVDESVNAFTITRNGTVTTEKFGPFNPNFEYSTTTIGGSSYFDGSVDYLTFPQGSITTNDYTIECWIYPTANTANSVIYDGNSVNLVGDGATIIWNSGTINFRYLANTTPVVTFSGATANQWYHLAMSKSGTAANNVSCYVNGVRVGQMTYTTSLTSFYGTLGSYVSRNANFYTGYISDFRVLIGTALYSGTSVTVPSVPLTAITNTSALLNFSNAGVINNALTNNLETIGGVSISTAQSKFGGSSIYFDGSADYLVSNTASSIGIIGTDDFTLEAWIYGTAFGAGNRAIYDQRPTSTQGVYPTLYVGNAVLYFYVSSANRITGPTLSINTWYHVALCRNNGSTKLFVNGAQQGSTYTDTNSYLCPAGRPWIGQFGDSAAPTTTDAALCWSGYIQDLRLTKGIARYTANFTVPSRQLPRC